MRDSIINSLSQDTSIQDACKKINYKQWRDLYQETFIALCEMKNDKLLKANEKGYLKWMTVNIIRNINKNKQRPQSALYLIADRAIEGDIRENIGRVNIDILEEMLDQKLSADEKLKFYESRLMRAYLKYGTYRNISKQCNIPYCTIQNTIKPYMAELRKYLLENTEING